MAMMTNMLSRTEPQTCTIRSVAKVSALTSLPGDKDNVYC